MNKRYSIVLIWIISFSIITSITSISLAAHGQKQAFKKAVLIAAFGSSVPEARKELDRIDVKVKQAFPGMEIRWAYTSKIIRLKLAKEGKIYYSPETALAKLMDDGFTHIAVLSLHTIPGEEFHDLNRNAHLFAEMAGGFEKIFVAQPLLSSHEDMVRVAKIMLNKIPANRKPEDAVILMGHGSSHHPSDAIYLAMNQIFQEMDPKVYVGTVSGYPSLKDLMPKLIAKKVKKVYLMPFMAVAGDHALNDMAGDEPDSWKSVLTRNGYKCETVLKGTAEYPEIVDVWIDHLRELMIHFLK